MKNLTKLFLAILLTSTVISCDVASTDLPELRLPFFTEDFQNVQHNTVLDLPGWINYQEAGTVKWKEKIYQGDGYAEFNSFGYSDASTISWLISPEISLEGKETAKLSFQTAQNFVTDNNNKIEAYISTNFDGTNVLAATWTKLNATVATKDSAGYTFIPSGEINLDSYIASGKLRIAFKATGSGTNTSLDGLFQVNNVYVYTTK
jgi:hypothetical protein